MYTLSGACHCGHCTISIQLSQPPATYAPRRCDCNFCSARQICYLSDPNGSIQIRAGRPLLTQRQGSAQAEFLTCSQCQTVLAVCYRNNQLSIGAVNASVLHAPQQLAAAVTVSPKLLSAESKAERWQQLWTPLVVEE